MCCENFFSAASTTRAEVLQKGAHGGASVNNITETSPLLLDPLRNCSSPYQSLIKRKGTIYSKVIQVYSNGRMSLLKSQSLFKTPTNTHTQSCLPLFAQPGQVGVTYLRQKKEKSVALLESWFLPVIYAQLGRPSAVPSISCVATKIPSS